MSAMWPKFFGEPMWERDQPSSSMTSMPFDHLFVRAPVAGTGFWQAFGNHLVPDLNIRGALIWQ